MDADSPPRNSEARRIVIAVARRVMAGGVPKKGFTVQSTPCERRFICAECGIDRPDTQRTLAENGWFGRKKPVFSFDNATLHPILEHGQEPSEALYQQAKDLLAKFPYYLNPEAEIG